MKRDVPVDYYYLQPEQHPPEQEQVHPNTTVYPFTMMNDLMNDTMSNNNGSVQVILPLEDFAEDLDLRLGRANGNIYHRRAGIENVHDGQVMVRLKKKRFIVLDYSIIPNAHDIQTAAMYPHITIPIGAGKTKCTVPDCNKVGVPVLLYDSEPTEPASLYLRSGLCFTCQRNLNEKRRTQRKRPSDAKDGGGDDDDDDGVRVHVHIGQPNSNNEPQHQRQQQQQQQRHQQRHAQQSHQHRSVQDSALAAGISGAFGSTSAVTGTTSHHHHHGGGGGSGGGSGSVQPAHKVLVAIGPGQKRIKLAHSNQPLRLAQDAIILNGPPHNTHIKMARDGHGFAEIGMDLMHSTKMAASNTETLLHSVNNNDLLQPNHPPPTSDDIARMYDASFSSLSQSIYLLTQWKESWDTAIAAAIAQEAVAATSVAAATGGGTTAHHLHHTIGGVMGTTVPTTTSSSLAEAVASAAAVAAAVDSTTTTTTNGGTIPNTHQYEYHGDPSQTYQQQTGGAGGAPSSIQQQDQLYQQQQQTNHHHPEYQQNLPYLQHYNTDTQTGGGGPLLSGGTGVGTTNGNSNNSLHHDTSSVVEL